jgi:superfamily II DNA or RNA helicase
MSKPAPGLGFDLRDYQVVDVTALCSRISAKKATRKLYVAPTGSGKTRVGVEVAKAYLAGNPKRRVVVLTPTRETATQWYDTFAACGIEAGYVLAGMDPDPSHRVQVGTVWTWSRRTSPPAGLVILDEAAHAPAPTFAAVFTHYKHAHILGMSGAPVRSDGRGLGEYFDELVLGPKPSVLVAAGWISDPDVYSWGHGIVRPTDTEGSEYGKKALEDASTKLLVGDIVEHRTRLASGLPTIAFGATVKHATEIAAAFVAAGIPAGTLFGHMPVGEREDVIARFRNGELQVLCTVDVLSEGFDMPAARCAILARPMRSLGKYLQQCGRVERPGTKSIILDHAGNAMWHRLPLADRPWTLEGLSKEWTKRQARVFACLTEACGYSSTKAWDACPKCGHEYTREERIKIEQMAGQLVPLRDMSDEEYWAALKTRNLAGGLGSAAARFREARGHNPPGWDAEKAANRAAAGARWSRLLTERLAAMTSAERAARVAPAIAGQTQDSYRKTQDTQRPLRHIIAAKGRQTRFADRESLRVAARRLNVAISTLRQSLHELGVRDLRRGVTIEQADAALLAHRSVPDDMEFLQHAAERRGMSRVTLARWMRQAGHSVPMHRRVSSKLVEDVIAMHPPQARGQKTKPEGMESVRQAAKRLGTVSENTIYSLLRRAGLASEARSAGVAQYFRPDDIDSVVAQAKTKHINRPIDSETLANAGARVGVTSQQLHKLLRAAGIDTSRGVLPADVDRVVAEHRAKKGKP